MIQKGLKNQLVRSDFTLEAISLEAKSTVYQLIPLHDTDKQRFVHPQILYETRFYTDSFPFRYLRPSHYGPKVSKIYAFSPR